MDQLQEQQSLLDSIAAALPRQAANPYRQPAAAGKTKALTDLTKVPRPECHWFVIYEAWCNYSTFGSRGDRDTLLLSLVHHIRSECNDESAEGREDQFQIGYVKVLELLSVWRTNFPKYHDDCDDEYNGHAMGDDLHPDDASANLFTCARNAMHKRARRRVTIVDEPAESLPARESHDEEEYDQAAAEVYGFCESDLDVRILDLKCQKWAHCDIAAELGVSTDTVDRRVKKILKKARVAFDQLFWQAGRRECNGRCRRAG